MKSIYPDKDIRSAKAELRLSNQVIANRRKMSATTVSKICNGKTNVELDSLIKVASELGFIVEIQFIKTHQ